MKFIHTADWHLGAGMASAETNAGKAREARFEAAERVLDVSREQEVDAVLVAGDLFDGPDIDDEVVRRAIRLLDAVAPIPVFIIPGNHDIATAGGVWDRSSWRPPDHVHLLLDREPRGIGDAVLYPCPLTQKQSRRDPTAWIPGRTDAEVDRIRVGLAHGGLDIAHWDTNFPIDPARAETADLDYLALGDWHGYRAQGDRTFYPGSIESTGFGVSDPGWALLVEVTAPGSPPTVEKIRTGSLVWTTLERDILGATDVEQLDADVAALGPAESLLLRLELRLEGELSPQVLADLDALVTRLAEACLLFTLDRDDAGLRSATGDDLPEGLLRRADEILEQALDGRIPEGAGREVASEPRDVLAEARTLLHSLARSATS